MNPFPIADPYELTPCRHGLMLVNRNDIYMGQALLKYGECCELELQFLLGLLRKPGLAVEAGANMGIHTVPLAKALASQGRTLYAFEPQPVIFQQLCANLALNGLTNVSAFPMACGNRNGAVLFEVPNYLSKGNFGGIEMGGTVRSEARHQTVPCVRLDDFLPIEEVGFLKIDVEGFELEVLKGAEKILERSQPILYLENDRIERSPQLIQWLFDHQYRLWWHLTPLFNAANFRGVAENDFANLGSCNMLCLPRSMNAEVVGEKEITDPNHHPYANLHPGTENAASKTI